MKKMKKTTHIWRCYGNGWDFEDRTPPCECYCNVKHKDGKKYIVPVHIWFDKKVCTEFEMDEKKGVLKTTEEHYRDLPDDPNDGVCY